MAVFHLTLFIVTIVILFIYLATRSRHTDSLTFVQEQQAIANFGVLGKPNLQSRLRARAIPNQRLIKAFGIVSSFTTEDPRIHNEFLRRASVDINKMGQSDCVEFFSSAKLSLSQTITHLDPTAQRALPLARVVRAFVLIAILNKFFRIEPSSVDVKAAIRAAEAINRLWVQSKNPDQEGQDVDQSILQSALELLLPKHFPCHPKDNPLNIIMPAYETMWRVVLLTYVAAGFQSQDETASRQFRGVVDMIPKCFSPEDKLSQEMALNFAKVRRFPPSSSPRPLYLLPFLSSDLVFANFQTGGLAPVSPNQTRIPRSYDRARRHRNQTRRRGEMPPRQEHLGVRCATIPALAVAHCLGRHAARVHAVQQRAPHVPRGLGVRVPGHHHPCGGAGTASGDTGRRCRYVFWGIERGDRTPSGHPFALWSPGAGGLAAAAQEVEIARCLAHV